VIDEIYKDYVKDPDNPPKIWLLSKKQEFSDPKKLAKFFRKNQKAVDQ
jgi:hypothetical protein